MYLLFKYLNSFGWLSLRIIISNDFIQSFLDDVLRMILTPALSKREGAFKNCRFDICTYYVNT